MLNTSLLLLLLLEKWFNYLCVLMRMNWIDRRIWWGWPYPLSFTGLIKRWFKRNSAILQRKVRYGHLSFVLSTALDINSSICIMFFIFYVFLFLICKLLGKYLRARTDTSQSIVSFIWSPFNIHRRFVSRPRNWFCRMKVFFISNCSPFAFMWCYFIHFFFSFVPLMDMIVIWSCSFLAIICFSILFHSSLLPSLPSHNSPIALIFL